jgi:general secretion pathway protein K
VNERGVAILMALTAMILMLVLALSVSYDTQVEYQVAAQKVNRLKAHYAARAGVEIGLYRILVYKKVMATAGSNIRQDPMLQEMVDQIWRFPFSWPPVVPDEANPVAKDKVAATVKDSFMDAQYAVTIESEGGKIDVNDLGSPVRVIAESTQKSLLNIFNVEFETNEQFARKHSPQRIQELINNMIDWVDDDQNGRNGASEDQLYEQPRDTNQRLPPNRPFRTLDELRMVEGMDDEMFDLIKNRITIFGNKGINPNQATAEVLKGLSPQITEEAAGRIIERRTNIQLGGPFRDDKDFFGFLQGLNVNTGPLQALGIPFYYDAEYNFRVLSSGRYKNVVKNIEVVTFDLENLSQRYGFFLRQQNPDGSSAAGATTGGNPPAGTTPPAGSNPAGGAPTQPQIQFQAPRGRPTVVLWQES